MFFYLAMQNAAVEEEMKIIFMFGVTITG